MGGILNTDLSYIISKKIQKCVVLVIGQQIGNRRLLQTAVPTLYLPDEENSAFTKFKQKPKLLGEVVVNDNSTPIRRRSRLRTKRSKSQNDPQEDQIPSVITMCTTF